MLWQIPMGIDVALHDVIAPALMKNQAKGGARTRRLVTMYCLIAFFALSAGLIMRGADLWSDHVLIVMVVGVFNAFAAYCRWRAVAISLSKTALFTWGDDLIAMGLSYVVLGEGRVVTLQLGIGITLSLAAIAFSSLMKARQEPSPESQQPPRSRLGLWILLYSIIWGVANFSVRYCAADGMPLVSFVAAWYGGSLLGAVAIFVWGGEKEAGSALTRQEKFRIIPLALVVWLSLMTNYWARMWAPLLVTQPIYQISEMVFPTLIGFIKFREFKDLGPLDKTTFAVGFVGATIIILSF